MNSRSHSLDKFLALDTAGMSIHCALLESGAIRHRSATRSESRTKNIAVLTDELLEDTALSFADIRGVIVTLGPGSFTGLRVGLSFAKGIVAALNVPLVGVTRFEQVFYQLKNSGTAIPDTMFITMKSGSFYRQRMTDAGDAQVDVITIAGIEKMLADGQNGADCCGLCCFIDCEIPELGDKLLGAGRALSLSATMEALFGAAFDKYEQEQLTPWTELEPHYVQRSAAELKARKAEDTGGAESGTKPENAN